MSFIRTVLADIETTALGACDAHEHLLIDHPFIAEKYPDFRLDDPQRAAQEMSDFRRAGGSWIVDTMPMGCGRSIVKLAEASQQSGVQVVCPTGLHQPIYYAADHWAMRAEAEQLAVWFIADIEEGIPAVELDAPTAPDGSATARTVHRAGVIKVASGERGPVDEAAAPFEAAAAAHRRTGCPIITHTAGGRGALQQAIFLRERGVDLSHVVLSHTDKSEDAGLHRALLETGACLEYDQAFRWDRAGRVDDNPTIRLLAALAEEFPQQLMLGMDLARRSYFRSFGGAPGIAWLLEELPPRLAAAGLTPAALARLLVENPRRAFAFSPTAA